MAKAAADYKDRLYGDAQRFWKELPAAYKRDEKKYTQARDRFVWGNLGRDQWQPADPKLPSWRGVQRTDSYGMVHDERYGYDLSMLLGGVLHHYVEVDTIYKREWRTNPPRRVQKRDVENLIGKSTGAKFTLTLGETRIEFDGRKVTWSVPENNHACEHAREHLLARTLFDLLARVQWTRGSGGTITGNNEYNQDSRDAGGGGNYVVQEFGPKMPRQRLSAYRY
jgi:hypothetical protein